MSTDTLYITFEILRLLEQKLNKRVTSFYDGIIDPFNIAIQDTPLINVQMINNDIAGNGTGTVKDMDEFTFQVTVWINVKNFYNSKFGCENFNSAQRELIDICAGRNASNFSIKDESIVGVIRDNLSLNGKIYYNNNVSVSGADYFNDGEYPLAKMSVTFNTVFRSAR